MPYSSSKMKQVTLLEDEGMCAGQHENKNWFFLFQATTKVFLSRENFGIALILTNPSRESPSKNIIEALNLEFLILPLKEDNDKDWLIFSSKR